MFVKTSKTRTLLFLLFLGFSALSQIKGVVKDESGKAIPYVNIWVENENFGTTAEEDGTFSINVNEEKNLVFSAMGYEQRALKANETAEVRLIQKVFKLNEVTIQKRNPTKEAVIGEFKGIELNSGVTNVGQENVHVWCKFIRFNEKIKECPFIKSIEFVTESHLKNVLLRIRIFNVDKDGIPIGDEVEDDILVPIKKGKKNNIVDLAKYNIRIPEEGILIGFEYLKLEQNKRTYITTVQGENGKQEKRETISYEPSILGFFPGGPTLLTLNRDGTLRRGTPINFGNVEIALKIKLTN